MENCFQHFTYICRRYCIDGNQSSLKDRLARENVFFYSTHQISNDSRFTIEVDYSNQSSTINLGFMIVEGSEQVTRWSTLKRGIDYQVDYFSGTIIYLTV